MSFSHFAGPAEPSSLRTCRWLACFVACFAGSFTTAAIAAPRVYRDRVEPHWFADHTRFWYRVATGPGAEEFVLVDAEKGVRTPAFDHARLATALSKVIGRPAAVEKLPIDSLDFESAAPGVVVSGGGKVWRLNLDTYELAEQTGAASKELSLLSNGRPHPSRAGGAETIVVFENKTGGEVSLDWVDAGGERRRYGTIKSGERSQQHTYAGHVWVAADATGRVVGVFEASASNTTAVIGEHPSTAPATRPAPPAAAPAGPGPRPRNRSAGRRGGASPDGKWTVAVRNDNLYLHPSSGGDDLALSDDGKAGDGYSADRVWWSPDSRHLFALKVEAGEEHKIYTVESSPKDQLQPKLRTLDYRKAGDRIEHPRPRLFDIVGHARVPVSEELCPNPWSIGDVRWAADSSRVTFLYNQRGHQALRVITVDAASGAATSVINETSNTFIDYSGKFFSHWLGDEALIWMSERDGWNHLWLYDARTRAVKNQITRGPWVVQGVQYVDEAGRQIWFRAGGIRPGQDPYYTHFCRVNFDGTGLTVLTEGDGTHAVRWSPGEKYLIDTWSRVDLPPVTELRRAADGKLLCRLEQADGREVLASRGGHWPRPFVAKGRDGATDIYGTILLPRDFDPAKKYPVLENIYAGPQGFFTAKAFRPSSGTQQRMADLGMIVVQCDGMGTSGRSKAFHDVCWKNLRDAGFPDRITWIKAAAGEVPQMDLSRVGIYGGSAGGQNAMGALLWHNDFYKVAVADCGCHDNRMDKIWWNEQWMGWPVGPEYAANSNAVNAHLLKGKLMLVFGELDDNVDPASTMQVVNALEKADKDFDLVVVTGAHHGAAETPYGSRRRAAFLARNLLGPAVE